MSTLNWREGDVVTADPRAPTVEPHEPGRWRRRERDIEPTVRSATASHPRPLHIRDRFTSATALNPQ